MPSFIQAPFLYRVLFSEVGSGLSDSVTNNTRHFCVVVWTTRNNTAEKASNMSAIVSYEDMHNNTGCCKNRYFF